MAKTTKVEKEAVKKATPVVKKKIAVPVKKPVAPKVVAKKVKPAKSKSGAVVVDDMDGATGRVDLDYGKSEINVNAKYALAGQDMGNVSPLDLAEYAEQALSEYGSYVVEDRQVVDYRDGLKPVHRALIWSLEDLGLRPSGPYKKSAQTVGRANAMYHPHGDASSYAAMVTLANTVPPAIAGQGNWGTPVDSAAAQRYTEAKMSRFTHLFLLDKEYIEVVPKIPNYSNDIEYPLYLPALLPFLMFNGSVPLPAYGVSCGSPTFQFESVVKVVIDLLRGKEYTHSKLAKVLKIEHPFGCVDVSSEEEFKNFISTGKGRITYEPRMALDATKRRVHIQTYVPAKYSSLKSVDGTNIKLAAIDGVSKAYSNCGKKNVYSGPWGAAYDVKCGRVSEDKFYDIASAVQAQLTTSITYRLGVTIRKANDRNEFRYMDYLTFFKGWIVYRLKLEQRLNTRRIEKAEREKHIQEVYLFAVDNIKKLLAILPKVLASSDPDKTMAKEMKMSVEDAKIILDRQVRKLAKLERSDIVDRISELKKALEQYQWNFDNAGEAAARDTETRVKAYSKGFDTHVYAGGNHNMLCYRDEGTMPMTRHLKKKGKGKAKK